MQRGSISQAIVHPLNLPDLTSPEIRLLQDGITGLGYTQSQVSIAYKTHRRAIGLDLHALCGNNSPQKVDGDEVINAKIFQDIDSLYRYQDAELEQDPGEDGEDNAIEGYDLDDDADMELHFAIDVPTRPATGKDFDWISPHLGMAALQYISTDNAGKHPTTIYRHVDRSFPARFVPHATENPPEPENQPEAGPEAEEDAKGDQTGINRAAEPTPAAITWDWIGREGIVETESLEFAGYHWF